jgi:hypothetical protein
MTGKMLTAIDVAHARLPATYEEAKNALAECERLDECRDWANKAEAIAAYAAMSKDDTLRTLADRIQARAVRRMGELLKKFDAKGKRTDKPAKGDHGKLSQREAARQAGLSEHQQLQAVRVANVPQEKFNAAVESEKPPTVTAIAEMGKQPRPKHDADMKVSASGIATLTSLPPHDIVEVKRCAKFMREHDLKVVWHSVHGPQRADFDKDIDDIARGIAFVQNLRKSTFS